MRSIPLPRKVLGLSLALLTVLAGCNISTRYPPDLRYPLRKDVLVVTKSGDTPDLLPSPGRLEEGIWEGLTREEVTDGKKTGKAAPKEGVKYFEPNKIEPAQAKALRAALDQTFGTPLRPRVESDSAAADELILSTERLAAGSELYRKHCMHCHGVAGDGRGPTGPWVHPHPRDYRSGKFKFLSTLSEKEGEAVDQKPSRADLYRVIDRGIDGTSMPAFGHQQALSAQDLNDLVSYVIHLSIRGQVEFDAMTEILSGKAQVEEAIAKFVTDRLNGTAERTGLLEAWALMSRPAMQLEPKAAYPEKYTGADKDAEVRESIRRGWKLFTAKGDGGCIACHNDYGRQASYRYDDWGTLVRPHNITVGTYRGGRRPIDFYWRIRAGIPPSGMPKQNLSDDATWDLVHFIQAMPYPNMLPKDVRDKVYGNYMQEPKKGDEHKEHAAASR